MTRRRPGGESTKRLAEVTQPDGKSLKVPAAKDVGTFLYVTEDGKWPKAPTTCLLLDMPYLQVGSTIYMEEMRPGHNMGTHRFMEVIDTRVSVGVFPGKYGQVKRLLLLMERTSDEAMDAFTADDLEDFR
ncbi:hypothetical protein [Deinococcus cellulosilyticus]|uniref:Uncharacterized protein n=1 Tax=Deinococcus cellulosilyticus (strain DSM 18568 / NBRC 106333 / KACC 11606 / 5516J-15) TaxID=1223518 RepID=A0A511MW39_DEIC1|nr:hypothetical protein [Deinococcus cellulosilyticus]GEM44793.1 hypothetical protein DC3_04280 [Deinococcus cellulosilyticus NBRC 106333 = KACC 11606]